MGNRHVHEIECLQTLGTSESGRQKVTALNLFYPTASPPLCKKPIFWHCDTASSGRGASKAVIDAYRFTESEDLCWSPLAEENDE